MSSNSGNQQTTTSWTSDYCYSQAYDAASGNYEPSTAEAVGQGADVGFCQATNNLSSY